MSGPLVVIGWLLVGVIATWCIGAADLNTLSRKRRDKR